MAAREPGVLAYTHAPVWSNLPLDAWGMSHLREPWLDNSAAPPILRDCAADLRAKVLESRVDVEGEPALATQTGKDPSVGQRKGATTGKRVSAHHPEAREFSTRKAPRGHPRGKGTPRVSTIIARLLQTIGLTRPS